MRKLVRQSGSIVAIILTLVMLSGCGGDEPTPPSPAPIKETIPTLTFPHVNTPGATVLTEIPIGNYLVSQITTYMLIPKRAAIFSDHVIRNQGSPAKGDPFVFKANWEGDRWEEKNINTYSFRIDLPRRLARGETTFFTDYHGYQQTADRNNKQDWENLPRRKGVQFYEIFKAARNGTLYQGHMHQTDSYLKRGIAIVSADSIAIWVDIESGNTFVLTRIIYKRADKTSN